MERAKYWIAFIMCIISISSEAQNSYRTDIYNSYLSGNMEKWKMTVEIMEKEINPTSDYLLDLINY